MNVAASLAQATRLLAGQPCVLSIGNFDGLHLGHQRILATVVHRARELNLPAVAMTFEPHPIQVLAPDKAPKRISSPAQKVRLIADCGIDLLYVAGFDRSFAALAPEEFLKTYLIEGLLAHTLCVGANFNFGRAQRGTVATLRGFADRFELVEVPPVLVRNSPASSTRVREAVRDGQVSLAARLLGRCFELEGTLESGAGRGRKVTVPTLNLAPENELLPRRGVYVTRIALDDGGFQNAVTNVGVKPTFDESNLTVETFVLGGWTPPPALRARLRFLYRIRDEQKFASATELTAQIHRDVALAERYFRRFGNLSHAKAHSH